MTSDEVPALGRDPLVGDADGRASAITGRNGRDPIGKPTPMCVPSKRGRGPLAAESLDGEPCAQPCCAEGFAMER